MISFSGEDLKLLGRLSPAWKFSATNSCSYFYSNLKHKKIDHHLSSYHAKEKTYSCQLNDLSKTGIYWHTSSQTGQPFSTQNTYRGDINGVMCPLEWRHSFFQSNIFRGENEDSWTAHLEIWQTLILSILLNCCFWLFGKPEVFPWYFLNT